MAHKLLRDVQFARITQHRVAHCLNKMQQQQLRRRRQKTIMISRPLVGCQMCFQATPDMLLEAPERRTVCCHHPKQSHTLQQSVQAKKTALAGVGVCLDMHNTKVQHAGGTNDEWKNLCCKRFGCHAVGSPYVSCG
jgi:hypothetical protein